MSVDPSNATVILGATKQFNANVSGTSTTDVLWKVDWGEEYGFVAADGVYQAPLKLPSVEIAVVRARSVVDPDVSAVAVVNLKSRLTEIGILNLPLLQGLSESYSYQPVVSGARAYLPMGMLAPGLIIADFSSVASPRLVTHYTEIQSRSVAVSNQWLFSVDGSTLDVLDRSSDVPKLLSRLALGNRQAVAVAVRGETVFVAGGRGSTTPALRTIDVSDVEHPTLLGSTAETQGADLVIEGSLAYVACYGHGLRIYDVSNPAAPQLVGEVDTGGEATKVIVEGSSAFVVSTGYSFSLAIVDVTNPASLLVTMSIAIPSELLVRAFGISRESPGLQIAGDQAYLAGVNGVVIVDLSTSPMPSILGAFGPQEFVGGLCRMANGLIAAAQSGLVALEVVNP